MRKIIILALALVSSIYWQDLDNVKAEYLLYGNATTGYIYKKISTDNSIGTQINSVNSSYAVTSPDGQYIVYGNNDDGGKCYKKSANDTSNGTAITSINCFYPKYSPDGLYIIYTNYDGVNNYIYKKSANDTSNGTAITSVFGLFATYVDNLSDEIVYYNVSNNGAYKKSANDTSNGTDFSPLGFGDHRYFDFRKSDNRLTHVTNNLVVGFFDDTGLNVYCSTPTYANNSLWNNSGSLIYYKGASDSNGKIRNIDMNCNPNQITTFDVSWISFVPEITGPINGTCGTNATTFSTSDTRYTGTFCSRGTASPTSPDFPLGGEVVSWSCLGSNSGSDASCSAYKEREILTPVNASCGTNVGTYHSYDTRYTGTFCSRGTASPTTPSFPGLGKTTTWICEGIYGGNNISCSASKNDVVTPLNGTCGTSAKVYTTSDTRYAGTFCARGTASPTTPSFPTSGNSISWSCNGIDGGVNMSCIASKETDENILGQCGTRRRMYGTGETRFDGTFCSRGTANPSSLSFPDIGRTVYWTCDGSFGYLGSVSCSAVRQGDGTTGTTFLGIDWSFISKPLDKISQALYNFIHFEANWLGFNFDFESLQDLFSLNLKGNTYTVNNSSCSNMLNNRITYQHNTWNYNGGIGNNGKGIFTSNTETCNVIRGTITYRSINNGGNILSSDFRVSNGDICSINTTLYNDGTYWANNTTQIENGFSYLTKTNTNDIINFNETIIQNIRIIPFSLVLFGFDLRQFLNTSITGLVEIIINIIIYPINILNVVYQDFSILFIQDFPATYCYYGMTISKITFTPTNYISSDIPYTSNLGIGIFVMIIFTISALAYLFKKFF